MERVTVQNRQMRQPSSQDTNFNVNIPSEGFLPTPIPFFISIMATSLIVNHGTNSYLGRDEVEILVLIGRRKHDAQCFQRVSLAQHTRHILIR